MGAHSGNRAIIQHNNHIRFLYRGDTLRNNQLGRMGQLFAHGFADHGIRPRVHGAGGVIHDKYFRLFQQGTGNTKPLLLSAGYVGTTLLNISIILVGEGLNELISLCLAAGMEHFLVRGIFVAPAEIVLDGAGEEHVLLQYDGNLVAQCFQIIVTHIVAAHANLAIGYVIQPGNQVDQRGFGAACSA